MFKLLAIILVYRGGCAMNKFAVTLNYNCNYGFVEYNEENKTAVVTLSVAEAKQR